MNKQAAAQLVMFGIPVTVLIIAGFRLWALNEVVEAVQPDLEKALLELDDSVVCPPEFSTAEAQVCISGKGEVVVHGNITDSTTFDLQAEDTTRRCIINVGEYEDEVKCQFSGLHELEDFNLLVRDSTGVSAVVNSANIQRYIFSNKYIKIPVKQWRWFWRVTKYVPK